MRVVGQDRDLLPHMVDRLARQTPDKLYGKWPADPTSYASGIMSISYAQLANIINGLAGWIVSHLGHGKEQIKDKDAVRALAYIGPSDVRSTALLLAAIKAGYVVRLFPTEFNRAKNKSLIKSCRSSSTRRETAPQRTSLSLNR